MQTHPTDLGLPLVVIDRNTPPPILRLGKSAERIVVGNRIRRRTDPKLGVVREVRKCRVKEGVPEFRQLIRRHNDSMRLHASHLAGDLRSLFGLGRYQVNPSLLHPLAVADDIDRRSRCIRQLPGRDRLDARPVTLHRTPDTLLCVTDRSARHQRERVKRSGQPIQKRPNRHKLRFTGGAATRERDKLVMTALVEHVIGPRMPDEVLRLLVKEHPRRVFEVIFTRQHVRMPLQGAKTEQLDGPV